MNILCLNLQPPTSINIAVYGNFSAPKAQEVVVARGNSLDLLRPDEEGRLITICSTPAFAVIRSLITFRLAGANRDYVVIGSDAGTISIVEYDTNINDWKIVHCEVFGRTGCRRIVPGQYLASDPKGRAIMIGAIEKQKFVYVMNRDNANKLTISSPLEAHKTENYNEADQDPTGEAAREAEKRLSYYELDLGLNHVVRKWAEPIARTANFLLSVPGGDNFPSGVLICGENWVSFKHQGHVEVRAPLPRRYDLPAERGVLITAGKIVEDVIIAYMDTIPLANNLCITKTGFLFAANEFGNHLYYQFQGIDLENAVTSRRLSDEINEELGDDSLSASQHAPVFKVHERLEHLLIVDEVMSLAPITDMHIEDLQGEDAAQLFTLVGRGNRSSLRSLRHGISMAEMAVSELPGRPNAVWTVKGEHTDAYDRYVIVSFSNATLVLSIGDKVEEVTDSGFLTNVPTLAVALLADNALIQVHGSGIRHIRAGGRFNEWKTPNKRTIQIATVNSRQVAIALSGGEIIYFELDETGTLIEMGSLDTGKEISALDLGAVPEGASRSMFLAVGYWDYSCQLLSLDPSDVLSRGPTFPVESPPSSIALVEMVKEIPLFDEKAIQKGANNNKSNGTEQIKSLYLFIGQERGVLLRIAVDAITGDFSDPRQKFLGSRPVKLCRVNLHGSNAVMALSSRAWLLYNQHNHYHADPLSYEALEFVSDFSSEACPDGLVAVAGLTLRILTIENLGAVFNQQVLPLRYTPRRVAKLPNSKDLAIIETDQNEFTIQGLALAQAQGKLPTKLPGSENEDGAMNEDGEAVNGNGEEGEDDGTKVSVRGPVPGKDGQWASAIRIVDLSSNTTKGLLELPPNEAAFSITTCRFKDFSEEVFLVVGSTVDLLLTPRKVTTSYLSVYRHIEGELQLLHKTEVEEVPYAMIEFHGKLLVGIGRSLRLYDLGKKKLLKKCENKSFPSHLIRLQTQGDRIYAADLSQSVFFIKYRKHDNVLSVFADDTLPRFITCMTVVDYNTVACGDKFGNVFILRLPETANDDIVGSGNLWDQGLLNGAPNKLDLLTHYYLGEMPTFIQKTKLKNVGKEVILVATVLGGIYALVPARSKEEANFFQLLEMFLRQESTTLTHRDHLSYRSFYQPVKNTVDGVLCEKFMRLSSAKQQEFSDSVDRTPVEVVKRLEDILDFI
eukprot:scaffold591_cov174-Ochromonas_danica.AAC.6